MASDIVVAEAEPPVAAAEKPQQPAGDGGDGEAVGEEGEQDPVVTTSEVLEEMERVEEEAAAVLGNDDGTACSFDKGFLPRQAVFVCSTCTRGPDVPSGVCFACSVNCHKGHVVEEIWTRRRFRCDCGSDRLTSSCALRGASAGKDAAAAASGAAGGGTASEAVGAADAPASDAAGQVNRYNQNYAGKYCVCHRPYPDPELAAEGQAEDEMLQCCVCEDWFHSEHLGLAEGDEPPDGFDELTCAGCLAVPADFLAAYQDLSLPPVPAAAAGDTDDAGVEADAAGSEAEGGEGASAAHEAGKEGAVAVSGPQSGAPAVATNGEVEPPATPVPTAEVAVTSDAGDASGRGDAKEAPAPGECKLEAARAGGRLGELTLSRALFWPKGWRLQLCRCASCLALYNARGVDFLIDPEDSCSAYEARNLKERGDDGSTIDRAMKAFSQRFDRTTQVELIHGFNTFAEEVKAFLLPYAASGKVVEKRDVERFMEGIREAKRQRSR